MIGVDSSPEMLAVARAAADAAGVGDLLDLRVGDLREPPVAERVPLVICPFRSLLHMETEDEKLRALARRAGCSSRAGASCSTSSRRAREDIEETHDRWLEREPGIFERAVWDEDTRTLSLSVRSGDERRPSASTGCRRPEWLRLLDEAGFEVEELYGWFDGRPYDGEEDMIFVCRKRG